MKLFATEHLDPKHMEYSHPCKVYLLYNHNHPITSAASLSYRDISESTKQRIYAYFSNGDSPAAAIHKLRHYLKDKKNQGYEVVLSESFYNPRKSDVYRLHRKWVEEKMGPESGEGMFQELEQGIDAYNNENRHKGGKAIL